MTPREQLAAWDRAVKAWRGWAEGPANRRKRSAWSEYEAARDAMPLSLASPQMEAIGGEGRL